MRHLGLRKWEGGRVSMRVIASLACKILGIHLIIQGVNVMGIMFSVFITAPDQLALRSLINTIVPFIFLIVFGVLLWIFSDKLSVIMLKEEIQPNIGIEAKVSDIQRISFTVLGLYFLGNSLPKLVAILADMYSMTGLRTRLLLSSGAAITEFIIGLGIFLGSQGLVNFLNTIRTAGLRSKEDNEEKE